MNAHYTEEGNILIREGFWKTVKNTPATYLHIVMVATKPDIIKQAPLYQELKKR